MDLVIARMPMMITMSLLRNWWILLFLLIIIIIRSNINDDRSDSASSFHFHTEDNDDNAVLGDQKQQEADTAIDFSSFGIATKPAKTTLKLEGILKKTQSWNNRIRRIMIHQQQQQHILSLIQQVIMTRSWGWWWCHPYQHHHPLMPVITLKFKNKKNIKKKKWCLKNLPQYWYKYLFFPLVENNYYLTFVFFDFLYLYKYLVPGTSIEVRSSSPSL